ncbi:hypothetical protein N9F12_01940 [Burkholderiaceae bacterium]|nr:hypothetical protein [Burkholderiaceae bacterium]
MLKKFRTPVGYDFTIDSLIVWLLVYLFVVLPFSVIDFSLFLTVFNRFLIIFVGGLCAYSALSKCAFNIRINGTFFILGIIFAHSFVTMLLSGKLDYAKEIVTLFGLVFIAKWARGIRVDVLANAVIIIALFYCADVLLQHINGVDLFGFEPRNGRIWGAFYFGAPTFGSFLSFVFFLPFFYLKGRWLKSTVVVIFAITMFIANDRAPIVQTILAVLLFMPLSRWHKLLAFGLIMTPLMFVTITEPSATNRVIAIYEGINIFLFGKDPAAVESYLISYGMTAYLDIWGGVIGGWFNWDNLVNVLFGTGWGSAPDSAARISDFGRPHNIHLELLIVWGVVGYAAFLSWLIMLYRRHRDTFVIFSTAVLPFGFFSLTSSNYLFMMTISYILFVQASHERQGLGVKKGENGGLRRMVMFPDAGRL